MFDRFSERARLAMGHAREQALQIRHDAIDIEHVLLGVSSIPDAAATEILQSLGVDIARLCLAVQKVLDPGPSPVPAEMMLPFTKEAKRMLECALAEASLAGHSYVGTEHLLLGILRDGSSPAAAKLKSAGATLENARTAMHEMMLLDDFGAEPMSTAGAPQHTEFERLKQEFNQLRLRVQQLEDRVKRLDG